MSKTLTPPPPANKKEKLIENDLCVLCERKIFFTFLCLMIGQTFLKIIFVMKITF